LQVAGNAAGLLIGHLGIGGIEGAGWMFPAGVRAGRGIPQDKEVRAALHLKRGRAAQPTPRVEGEGRLQVRHAGGQAGGPDHAIAAQGLHAGRAIPESLQLQPIGLDAGDTGVQAQPDVPLLQGLAGLLAVEGLGNREQLGALLHQFDDGAARQQIGQLAGQFDAAGAGPHDPNPLQGRLLGVELFNPALDLGDVLQGAKADGVLADPRDAIGLQLAATGNHGAAVGQLASAVRRDRAVGAVDARGPLLDPNHAGARQEFAVAGGDLPAFQLSAEQFVEQGQKEKVLAGLEQHHRRVLCGGRQLQSGIETTEATADHHNSCGLNLGWGHGRRWRRRPGRTLTISPHIGRWCDDHVCLPLRTQLRSAAGL